MMFSPATDEPFVSILDADTVLFAPSCLLTQVISDCISRMSRINITGKLTNVVPEMLAVAGRLVNCLDAASRAYARPRTRFFPEDWRRDKARCQELVATMLANLDCVGELVGCEERRIVEEGRRHVAGAWASLAAVMDEKGKSIASESGKPRGTMRFRDENPRSWKQSMASALLSLHANTEYPEDAPGLILVCYKRVRISLLQAIEDIERRSCSTKHERFAPEKILCIYNDNTPTSCPKCQHMTSLTQETRKIIRGGYFKKRREENNRSARLSPASFPPSPGRL